MDYVKACLMEGAHWESVGHPSKVSLFQKFRHRPFKSLPCLFFPKEAYG